MIYTKEMEKQVSEGTNYWDCFKGVDLGRTEIVCLTCIAQTLSGTVVGGLSSFYYTNPGIITSNAYSLALGQTGIGAVGTIGSWFIMNKVGRKKLMCWGMVVMFCLLMCDPVFCLSTFWHSSNESQSRRWNGHPDKPFACHLLDGGNDGATHVCRGRFQCWSSCI
jgi:hypothetical protein